ncbi:MAG: cation-translocating P-type ATPase [Acetobacteraceae bacterium]
MSRLPHTLTVDDVAAEFETDLRQGLSADQAAQRAARFGPNALPEAGRRGPLPMLASQFTDFMILLLIAAAAISGIVGDIEDTIVILAIVVLNAAIGFVQEYRAEQALSALQRLAPERATVVRTGAAQAVLAEGLVPGDVVLLEAGNAVPADLRLVEAVDLKLGEAALTGESLPAEKSVGPLPDPGLPLGDRGNMAFKGTIVLFGHARGVVVATGMATELGRIATLLEQTDTPRTPLQQRLAAFGRQIAIGAVAICIALFLLGLARGEPALLMLLTAISLAVAAIPEAMPAVVTVLLALGARRMAQEHALIRRLPAVETLGSVTVICSDKTGTLTRNEMRATEVMLDGQRLPIEAVDARVPAAATLLKSMALCNDVVPSDSRAALGEPTELALWRAAADAGFDRAALLVQAPRVRDLPFDSDRKRMTTIHAGPDGLVAYVKGAPESVLPRCTAMATRDGIATLDPQAALHLAEAMAADGLRVLALAWRPCAGLPDSAAPEAIESDLILLGLAGLLDPPRPETAGAVATCRQAGIIPVMITGDHPATARAVARQIGLIDDDGFVMTGRDLADLSDLDLREQVASVRVYARVDPAQKIRIVAALQDAGQIAAMTGDGVNDAPALARANIGVAMGQGGTDVARQAAGLVLLDDNFATIVAAVREGRRIYDNIRKFVRFIVTCNAAEILTLVVATLVGLPVPLLPIQILWINLVTDGLPGLALAAEPAERDVMRRPPRAPTEGLLADGILLHIVWVGALMAGLTLATQALALQAGLEHWRTMVFAVLTFVQMAHVLAIRVERHTVLGLAFFSNPAVLGAVAVTLVLQGAAIYVPALNAIFDTQPLSLAELAVCMAVSGTVLFAVELEKWVRKRCL